MDHLDTLRAFVGVAEAKGFAAAARRLQISAPAVTRAVAALEARLGVQLLERSTRSVRLTEIGERFLGDCKRILAELDEAEASAAGAHAAPQGELGLTAPSMFGRRHVAPIALDFLEQHPQVSLRTFFVDRVVHLLDEGFDVAVRIAHLPDSSLTAVRVGSVRRVVVASPAYLEAHGMPQAPAELQRHAVIGFSADGGNGVAWTFSATLSAPEAPRNTVPMPRVQLVANAAEVAIDAALRGHGLASVLSYQVDAEVRSGQLCVVLAAFEPVPIPVHVVYVAGRKAPGKVRAFIDFAVERLRREPVLRDGP